MLYIISMKEKPENVFGTQLKKLRKELGYSAEKFIVELAKGGFEVSRETLRRYETGKTAPDVKQLTLLCYALKKPSSYFFPDDK